MAQLGTETPALAGNVQPRQFQKALDAFEQTAADPLHRAFLTRVLQAATKLATSLDDELLGEATSSSSDFEVLVSALSSASNSPLNQNESALLKAKLRGAETKRKLLEAEGGTASSSELAKLLGISRQAVDKRRKNNQLIAVQHSGRGYQYPLWQLVDGATLFGLPEVLSELSAHDDWMTVQFFLRENPRLQSRPVELLRAKRSSDFEKVLAAAQTYGTQGAD